MIYKKGTFSSLSLLTVSLMFATCSLTNAQDGERDLIGLQRASVDIDPRPGSARSADSMAFIVSPDSEEDVNFGSKTAEAVYGLKTVELTEGPYAPWAFGYFTKDNLGAALISNILSGEASDPRAVLDALAIVPASKVSPAILDAVNVILSGRELAIYDTVVGETEAGDALIMLKNATQQEDLYEKLSEFVTGSILLYAQLMSGAVDPDAERETARSFSSGYGDESVFETCCVYNTILTRSVFPKLVFPILSYFQRQCGLADLSKDDAGVCWTTLLSDEFIVDVTRRLHLFFESAADDPRKVFGRQVVDYTLHRLFLLKKAGNVDLETTGLVNGAIY